MKCAMCEGIVKRKRGGMKAKSRALGTIIVPNITYLECDDCGDIRYNESMAIKIHEYVKSMEREAIGGLPIGQFVTANEAANMLGITKQAFSKNPKIKNGFIYTVEVGGRKYYHRRSVELFNAKGDGRFSLVSREIRYQTHQKFELCNIGTQFFQNKSPKAMQRNWYYSYIHKGESEHDLHKEHYDIWSLCGNACAIESMKGNR